MKRREPDFVGHTIDEYTRLGCEDCNGVEKTVDLLVSDTGEAITRVRCDVCGLTNHWAGHVDPACL